MVTHGFVANSRRARSPRYHSHASRGGAQLRGRSLPARIQAALCQVYGIDDAPAVDDFIRPCEGEIEREVLLVREDEDGVEVAIHLPQSALDGRTSLGF